MITGRGVNAYRSWVSTGLTRRTSKSFGRVFNDAAKNAEHTHFNLDGIDDVLASALKGRGGFGYGMGVPWTLAELNLIRTSPELLAKTTFYRGGRALKKGPF